MQVEEASPWQVQTTTIAKPTVDTLICALFYNGGSRRLSRAQTNIALLLAEKFGDWVTWPEILESLAKDGLEGKKSTASHIQKLRIALAPLGLKIVTKYRIGYCMVAA